MLIGEFMNNPLVSVIIPAYNCASYICQAVDSALDQEVSLEILVINDCSPDDLDQVMERYQQDARVRYLCNERNLGAAQTRNRGVSLAMGEYVAFLDGDDRWKKGKLAKQLAAMEASGAVLCTTARELMTPEGKPTGRILSVKKEISYRELLKHNSISCSAVLIRTEAAREFPMHHEDSHEDYIMWLEVLQKYGIACGVNEPLLLYRLSNTGKSGSKLKSARMTFMVYRYMGFNLPKSMLCFCSYALHGIRKYVFSRFGESYEA